MGRFTLLARAGAGAMGQVFAAYDPALDRRIALKLLRTRGTLREHDRLLREAKALARLSSPNVVSVYEVAADRGRVLIAMEYVDGGTLRQWAADNPLGGDERFGRALSLLVQAGRGLQAAHAAGLVHRDFKPSNVLIGLDGRVRVADFGLARAQPSGRPEVELTLAEMAPATSDGPTASRVTRTGTVVGTPAYMAPEQFEVGPVGTKADQFSFALTAWELLFGERPTGGRSALDTPLRPSATLERALHKGMSRRPSRRHESMAAFLDAIQSDARWRRYEATAEKKRTKAWIAATVVGLVGTAAGGNWVWGLHLRAQCARVGDGIDNVWNDAARERVREGLVRDALPYSLHAVGQVLPRLDRYADAWRTRATEACMNLEVHRVWDAELFERSRWCLDEQRLELSGLAVTWADADSGAVQGAVQGAASLPKPEECLDRATLLGRGRVPSEPLASGLAALRQALAVVRALEVSGRYDEGLTMLRHARDGLEESSAGALDASALAIEATLLRRLGRYARANEVGEAAFMSAVRFDAWHVAARVAIEQVFLLGSVLADESRGQLWSELAEVAIARSGDPYGLAAAGHAQSLGALFRTAGERGQAKRLASTAVDLWERALGPGHPLVANALSNLANAHADLGEFAVALEYDTRALELWRVNLGAAHPSVAEGLASLGTSHLAQGDLVAAQEAFERGLAIWGEAVGDSDVQTALFHSNLGQVHQQRGERDAALTQHRLALSTYRACLGDAHPDVAMSLVNIGGVLAAQGKSAEAEATFREALDIVRAARGENHPEVGIATYNLGDLLYSAGRDEEAFPLVVEAVSIFEDSYGNEDPRLAYPLTTLGEIAAARGDPEAARISLERALTLRAGVPSERSASTRFALARVLWDSPVHADPTRALELAGEALAGYADRPDRRAEVEAWVKTRPDQAHRSGARR